MRSIYLLLIIAGSLTTTVNGQRSASYSYSFLTPAANNFTDYSKHKSPGSTVEIAGDMRPEALATGTGEFTAPPSCDVTNLSVSSITTTSANLNWDVTSGVIGYEYAFTTSGIPPASGTATTNNFVTPLTGLSSGTVYYAHSRANCGSGFGNWSTTSAFTTVCDPVISYPFVETFETSSATRICWKKNEHVTGALDWTYGAGPGGTEGTTSSAHSGALNAGLYEGEFETINVTKLISPKLDLSSLTGGAQVRFWYVNEAWLGSQDELRVYYKTSAGGTWTLIPGATFDTDQPTWIEATLTLPSVSNDYYIAFESTENYGLGVAIDDIVVEAVPTCFTPFVTSLSAVATSKNTATIKWAAASPAPSNGYQWKIVLTGAGPGGSAVASGNSAAGVMTANATGLTMGVTYDLFVRSNCDGSGFSSFVGPKPFFLNDDAAGAITLTVGAGCTGAIYSNVGATRSNLNTPEVYPSCSGTIVAPVWFKFVAPASGAVRISTDLGTGNSFADSKLGLFAVTDSSDYSSSSFTIISCDDDGGSALGVGYMSVVYATGLIAGNTYYVAVDRSDSTKNSGTFCIDVNELDNTMIASSAVICSTSIESPYGSTPGYAGWVPIVDDANSRLIALIKNPAGGIVGDYNVSLNVNTSGTVRTDPASSQRYLDRNFHLDSAGVSTVNSMQVQLFFKGSELSALQAVDAGATLAGLGVTRQSGATCQGDFVAANGTNSYIAQTNSGTVNGTDWISFTTPGLSNFYLHQTKASLTIKAYLQGAYSAGLSRHKDVTPAWAAILNANALNQPYNTAAFGNYNGGESVPAGFFTSNPANALDPLDWVLLEVKDATLTTVFRRAAIIREDGKIVDTNGDSLVTFNGIATGNYYVTIRHRNHLGISTQNLLPVSSKALGATPPSGYDFDFAGATDANIFGNALAYKVVGGNSLMICGNANTNTSIKYGGSQNDVGSILLYLSSDPLKIINNVYTPNDVNMDGTVKYGGGSNDPGFLFLNALGSAPLLILNEQKR